MTYKVAYLIGGDTVINFPLEADKYWVNTDGILSFTRSENGSNITVATFNRGFWLYVIKE